MTPAINKLAAGLKEPVVESAKEWGMQWYRSFQGTLNRSKIGQAAVDLIKSDYEPLWKKAQLQGRQQIENVFNTVPEHLHADVHDVAMRGVTHNNPLVNTAGQTLRRLYNSQQVAKPVDMSSKVTKDVAGMWLDWNQSYSKRFAREHVFGEGDEAIVSIIKGANRERTPQYANAVADGFATYFREDRHGLPVGFKLKAAKGEDAVDIKRFDSPYFKTEDWEKRLRSGMAWMFTPRIMIPHLSQFLNSVLVSGVKPTAQALTEIFKDKDAAFFKVASSGAFEDEMHFWHLDAIHMNQANPVVKMLLHVKQPGFKTTRKWQMVLSGLGGKYAANEYAAELIQSGGQSKRAELALKYFGIDHNKVLQTGALSPDDELKAIYRATEEAMFIRTGIHTPPAWDNSSATRLAFMYKHYAFNEGRLIADTLKRQFAGNKLDGFRTIAMLSTIFPAVGFGVKSLLNVSTGHDYNETPESTRIASKLGAPREVDDYFDAFGHIAGLGIGYSIMRSARRRALSDFFVGPIFGSAIDLSQDIMSGNKRELVRDVSRKAGFFGPLVTNIGLPPEKQTGRSSGGYGKY